MKKILLVMSVAILIALCSAPSLCKADDIVVGTAYSPQFNGVFPVYCSGEPTAIIMDGYGHLKGYINNSNYVYLHTVVPSVSNSYIDISIVEFDSVYIPTAQDITLELYSYTCHVYASIDDFYDAIPEEFRPVEISPAEQKWLDYYEWFKEKFGFYPLENSLIDIIRKIAIGDWTEIEEVDITFPTLTPAPPSPTPIPVQTIFVPDGNGSTTIIYQYTDPTTGVITQSPYNPNIDIDVNCNCNDGDCNNTFGNDPTDPTALTSSMLWADGFGVEITDNPLTAANDSQKSLAEAAAEYSDSVNVVSNSFNVLPFKWLMLVGLLGGILIIAGLLRTFLGG